MNAKKLIKLPSARLYAIAGIIVTILAALILYILVRGIPHISWSFWTSRSSSYKAGGGIGVQLYNLILPIGYYFDYFCASFNAVLASSYQNMLKRTTLPTLSVPV